MDSKKIDLFFLFKGKGLSGIDLSRPDTGNPGIGGTQFCFLLLGFYLKQMFQDKYRITFFTDEPLRLPKGIECVVASTPSQIQARLSDHPILIVKQSAEEEYYDMLSTLKGVKIVHWTHNFLYGPTARRVAREKNIVANVFVSNQLYDFYVDHDIIKKSIPIFNIVPPVDTPPRKLPEIPEITYIGQISRAKGIIHLLKVWKEVRKRIPECRLNIIGKGNLYDRNATLGPLGIADTATESAMEPFILTDNHQLDPNVRFLGILGKEKYEVFANSTVGMVNPSARTETFGMGIVEMASAALPVVTKKWNGHPDTARDGYTSLLAYTIKGMAKNVVRLIKDPELNLRLGENAKSYRHTFSPEAIIPQWNKLLSEIFEGVFSPPIFPMAHPYLNNYKQIRRINASLRHTLRIPRLPAVVDLETYAMIKMRKLISTLRRS